MPILFDFELFKKMIDKTSTVVNPTIKIGNVRMLLKPTKYLNGLRFTELKTAPASLVFIEITLEMKD